ncbi:hypothetical protein K501DRAFT_278439 [Backusella circina FSU 941]|nr:hypothetical protein K501DRAFT_278439 [Backusella circina FSU 941]
MADQGRQLFRSGSSLTERKLIKSFLFIYLLSQNIALLYIYKMDMSPFAFNNDLLNDIPPDLLTFTPELHGPTGGGDNTAINNITDFSGDIVNNIMNDTGISDGILMDYVSPADVSLHSSLLTTPQPTPDYSISLVNSQIDDLEDFLTPLMSPAVTPSYSEVFQFQDTTNENYFTPLSSPALPPDPMKQMVDNTLLYQQLQQIESKQQKLRDKMAMSPVPFKSPHLRLTNPPSPLPWQLNNGTIGSVPNLPKKKHSLRQKIAMASPQLKASSQQHLPATPASLMNISTHQHTLPPSNSSKSTTNNQNNIDDDNNDNVSNNTMNNYNISSNDNIISKNNSTETSIYPTVVNEEPARKKSKLSPTVTASPRTLKPLISPFLQPDSRISLAESETSLASKSNYQNLLEGKARSLGMNFGSNIQSGVENRRSAHKVAEQRRRDTLKQSFDYLRDEIIDVIVLDTLVEKPDLTEKQVRYEKEKEVKLMSKVLLLQQSYEYIVRLKKENKVKDDKLEKMQLEIDELRKMMSKDDVS